MKKENEMYKEKKKISHTVDECHELFWARRRRLRCEISKSVPCIDENLESDYFNVREYYLNPNSSCDWDAKADWIRILNVVECVYANVHVVVRQITKFE